MKPVFLAAVLMLAILTISGDTLLIAQTPGVYTLRPEKLSLARHLFKVRTLLYFGGSAWSILHLWLLLSLRVVSQLRNLALRVTRNRWGQCFLFTFLLLFCVTLLNLPLHLYAHRLGLRYGLSVQGWGSWFGDAGKDFVLAWGFTGLAAMLLFWLIRRSPRRWWAWFWLAAMMAIISGVLIAPILIDPLFYTFEPLAAHHAALASRLEEVVRRGPLTIPPGRMFCMRASAKSTEINAYVTGLGPSKRVVVWDTSIAKASPDEIAFIFGHEMGHYVLHHIYRTLAFTGVLLFAAFWMGFHLSRGLLKRLGAAWKVESEADWAALAIYMMVLAILMFLAEPLINGYSREQEHAADIYAQEAVHGIVDHSQLIGAETFQLLGENALEDPTLHPWIEFWSYDHPATARRAAFAATYDPWRIGEHPRYIAK